MTQRSTPRKIAVTTPSGHVGARVVQLLIQAGMRPTVLTRSPARLDAETLERVDVVRVDQSEADAVVRATRGVDSLFWVDPPHSVDGDPVAGYARMGASAARAIIENGISRTVFLSSVGAEKREGAGEIDGLARTEELLNDTGADVLHLRCGYFFTNLLMNVDGLRGGVLDTPWPLDHPLAWVDPRDIGEVAVARLLGDWTGRHVQAVHGPQDLTFEQVAEILGDALGRDVRAAHVNEDEFRGSLASFGLGRGEIDGIVGMSSGLSGDFVADDARSIATTTPSTLGAWAYQHLRSALAG